ncbi:efflux RND transporter periplasmic adaptor subunit [Falsiroseomonas bella]|uniref:Efflux RND transporter periplasmic adaptor subunit n=1 Tax=Falsiroseomonas bella TaxID=2184016 RepID=A0A317FFS1_9PROT|nr:efflux RND transporter periplasmic adaptor subunit [Falsiroseomonas bella]PWS37403.1 efflux RND transporter periplasmic adaptor subunit [Falsiroseomonas bella]
MRLRSLLLLLAALVVIGGGVAVARLRPIAVAVAPVEQDVAVTVFGLGSVEAQVVARIGFEVSGTLVRVAADHGDLVRAGDELAALNPASAEARLARAEAGLQSAEAAAARAEAQRDRAEALSAQRQATARRRRDLATRGVGSQESAELAETEAAAAVADVAVNRADAAVARAAIADARANLLAERTALAKHRLLAPFDALVVTRHREPGTALNPGEAVFTLVAPDSYWVLAFVDEGRAGGLAVGQPARVTLRSRPGQPMTAEVVRIGLEADRVTEERRVWLRCRGCPGQPVLGEQAEVLIETGRLPRARLLPESALHGFDGAKGTIWTVEDGRLARREVRVTARLADGRVALTEGLPEGAEPVLRAASGFAPGRAARPVPGTP